MRVSSTFNVHRVIQCYGLRRMTVACSALTEALSAHLFNFRPILGFRDGNLKLLLAARSTDAKHSKDTGKTLCPMEAL